MDTKDILEFFLYNYFAAIILFPILYVFFAVRIVPQGYEYTVERFGKYIKTIAPGFHMIIPIIDRTGAKVNMMETVLEIPSQNVITKDNAAVHVDGVVFFQILDAAKASYKVNNLHDAIINLTMTNIRNVMGSMDLDDLLSHREAINDKLLHVVDDATTPWGTKVIRIQIKDIHPPKDLVDSMARQMKAERDKRAATLKAEGERNAAILEAEGERNSHVLRAEGLQRSMILEAEGRKESAIRDAEARERMAMAEAKAIALVSKAIEQGNMQATNYFVATQYVEALKVIGSANNQKLVFMPLEASSIVASIGGIMELTKKD